jgi:nitrogen fixation/metabolism regulation signal transduction histidine kinase
LTPIQLSAERLDHKLKNKLNKEEKNILSKATQTIVKQVNALKIMVNEFADYARPVKIEKKLINMDLLIRNIMDLYEAVDVQIKYKNTIQNLIVCGDENKLRQVIINLIENAKDALVKITNPNIIIIIKKQKNKLILQVEDNGVGVPKDIISKIFEPYVTSKSHGTGLGLPIVLKIIDEHNGTITIKNNKIAGTTVLIKLPLVEDEKS